MRTLKTLDTKLGFSGIKFLVKTILPSQKLFNNGRAVKRAHPLCRQLVDFHVNISLSRYLGRAAHTETRVDQNSLTNFSKLYLSRISIETHALLNVFENRTQYASHSGSIFIAYKIHFYLQRWRNINIYILHKITHRGISCGNYRVIRPLITNDVNK